MDTKSKKFRYSAPFKFLCFALSCICFFAGSVFAFTALSQVLFYNSLESTANPPSLKETDAFRRVLYYDIDNAVSFAQSVYDDSITDLFDEQEDEIVDKATDKYLTQRAEIIKAELEYVAAHEYNYAEYYSSHGYDAFLGDGYTAENGNTTSYFSNKNHITSEDTSVYDSEKNADETTTLTDTESDTSETPNINSDDVLHILANIKGQQFNKYDYLVRTAAFEEKGFAEYGLSVKLKNGEKVQVCFNLSDYINSNPRNDLTSQYRRFLEEYISNSDSVFNHYRKHFNKYKNLHLMINDYAGKTVYSSFPDGYTVEQAKKQYVFVCCENDVLSVSGISLSENNGSQIIYSDAPNLSSVEYRYSNHLSNGCSIYMYVDNYPNVGDIYGNMDSFYNDNRGSVSGKIFSCAVFFALSVAALVFYLCLCGHKNIGNASEIRTAFIDKLPFDIHTLLSLSLTFAFNILSVYIIYKLNFDTYTSSLFDAFRFSEKTCCISAFCLLLAWMSLTELIASAARSSKAHLPILKRCAVYKLIKLIVSPLVRLVRFIISFKPKTLRKRFFVVLLVCAVFELISFFAMLECMKSNYDAGFFLMLSAFIAVNAFLLYKLLRYLKLLDIIIASSSERSSPVLPEKSPESLSLLADNLSITNRELEESVAKAVKNERMRSELITNVSHDLKTPLTSVISYVDLLKKCDISDPEAKKYLDVLSDKSVKLKYLIEDLIEASKISTGNITLSRVKLSLGELAMQAVVEATPEFEKRNLNILFEESEDSPFIFADSQKTYRIFENLLNNAYKYSAEGTRVYTRIYSDGKYGCFEMKNISKEPLNISPDELTERFIRGDKSRSHEGNGLGLSIAKDLAAAQDGKLEISIDGDLFKITVFIPLASDS